MPAARLEFDALPKLREAIGGPASPAELSSNLSEWRATGLYVGLGLAGDAEQAIWLRDVDLQQEVKLNEVLH